MATDEVPYLTIAVTNECNFKCVYCSPDGEKGMGEAYHTKNSAIDFEDLEKKILIAEESGVKKVRFTGGEPLVIKGLPKVLHFIEDNTSLQYALATNGSLIDRFIDEFEGLSRLDIRISLDTLNREKFVKTCRCSAQQYDKVMGNIKLLANKKLLNRVAAVVFRENIGEIGGLIDFCEELGINLKLFDMYATPDTKGRWNEDYVFLDEMKRKIEKRSTSVRQITYTQSFGIPALEYETKGGIHVRVKDSMTGTRYNNSLCSSCPALPCQEGLYTILYSSDKKLIPCRLSPTHFDAETPEQFKESLVYLIRVFQEAYHENRFWENEK